MNSCFKLNLNKWFCFIVLTWVFKPCRGLVGKQSWGLLLAVKCKKTSIVSCCVKIPVWAALLANSSKFIAGSLIKYKADPRMKKALVILVFDLKF